MKIPNKEDWQKNPAVDARTKAELSAICSPQEEEDRFYRFLSFGTGGLRGKMGAGNNRINLYTVRRATAGLGAYLKETEKHPSVCIAYDTRNGSQEFAKAAAEVLAAADIEVLFYDGIRPTPMLSWAVRYHKAAAGIVITASHNPREYNGYKVYGADGGQITDHAADSIQKQIERFGLFDLPFLPFSQALKEGKIRYMGEETDAPYYRQVRSLSLRGELLEKKAKELKILYSPLHGTGNLPVRRVLRELGFSQVSVVAQQELPDGNFPTAPRPNPENREVFTLAMEMAQTLQPDLIFATDPDCDRIGVLSQDEKGEYAVLTGNQTGALLTEYILHTHSERGTLPKNAAVIKTIVSSSMAEKICAAYGIPVFDVLTGFKYIGELAESWQKNGDHVFLFGFEESYGYLAGNFVRDKDAVIAAALIAEMALWYKQQGKTLYQALNSLFQKYGWHQEKLISIELPGKEGQEQIERLLAALRRDYGGFFAGKQPVMIEDYQQHTRLVCSTGERIPLQLPASNVLKFFFEEGSWLVLRPSGTEPKIKCYLSVRGSSKKEAEQALSALEKLAARLIG